MPSNVKEKTEDDEFVISKLPLKKQQQMKRKAEAASSTFNWNSMYMNVRTDLHGSNDSFADECFQV